MAEGQPDRKLAGKYTSIEELEKGYSELMGEMRRVKEESVQTRARAEALERYNKQLEGVLNQPAPKAPRDLMDEDGRLDQRALISLIEERIGPIEEQMKKVPEIVGQSVGAILEPLQQQLKAGTNFWSREDVEEAKFTAAELNRFVDRNEGIKLTYEAMLENPKTAERACDYVFNQWRTTRPKSSAVDDKAKQAAGNPRPAGTGPAELGSEEEGSWKRIRDLEAIAAQTQDPTAIQAALRERFKGTKVLEELEDLAREKGWKP